MGGRGKKESLKKISLIFFSFVINVASCSSFLSFDTSIEECLL